MDAQWSNPEFAGKALRGATVLVVCQARDFTTQAVCEDQAAAPARGARHQDAEVRRRESRTRLRFPTWWKRRRSAPTPWPSTAVRISTYTPAVNSRPTIGIGVGGVGGSGGYGGGYRGGSVGGGITLPVGGGATSEAFASDTAIVDVATGKLMWSGRAASPSGSDTMSQLADLTRVTFEALSGTGLI